MVVHSERYISEEDISEEDITEEDISEEDISEEDISEEDISEEDVSEEDFCPILLLMLKYIKLNLCFSNMMPASNNWMILSKTLSSLSQSWMSESAIMECSSFQ